MDGISFLGHANLLGRQNARRSDACRFPRSGASGIALTMLPSAPHVFREVRAAGGDEAAVSREVPAEVPVALEYDGIGYAVLMATPADVVDLAYGFALAERLIEQADELSGVEVHAVASGLVVRGGLAPDRRGRLHDRVRHRATDSSCGLCGVENLEQALRPLPPVTSETTADDAAIFRALGELRGHQALGRATAAVHAAAWCRPDGAIALVREDVGRHNAFDKLIGAMARVGEGWGGGFALLTSRCSYELVEKAVLAGCPMLATISAPTGLALSRAREAGLRLRVLARSDSLLAAE